MPRYFLRKNRSPTYYNLAKYLSEKNWRSTIMPFFANFSEKNLDYNHEIANQLEFKNKLAELAQTYCPDIIPETKLINDQNYPFILKKIQKDNSSYLLSNKIWILKPALLNNGQHIKIFNNIENIKTHFLSTKRMGGEHVLQEYIASPHLLKGPKNEGHKYSIRMFMVLTNYDGAFLYPNGYFNIAVTPYNASNFDNLTSHITNEHLQEGRVNVIQIPTFRYDLFKPLYPALKHILTRIISGLLIKYPDMYISDTKSRKLAIFGMDFMVDANQKIWLIEANHAPCFPITADHDLQNSLYADFWRAMIENFVLPIGKKSALQLINYQPFERLN